LSAAATAKRAEVVVVGNKYLANWFDKFSKNLCVIPTAVDTEKFQPGTCNYIDNDRFVIGWIGTQATLPYLEAIESPLHEFVSRTPEAQILVLSDKFPSFKRIPNEKVDYIPWSEESEVKVIQKMNVGLMPLSNTEWTRGKCAFKMIQYMACGIPVVVSPVGMNAEVLSMGDVGFPAQTESDWYEAFVYLFKNRDHAQKIGKNGRVVVQKNFDLKIFAKQIAEIFLSLR
jgi:glycosyltransferase involved in cell wall biosynthesis